MGVITWAIIAGNTNKSFFWVSLLCLETQILPHLKSENNFTVYFEKYPHSLAITPHFYEFRANCRIYGVGRHIAGK